MLATEENIARFNDFKELMAVASKAKINFSVKNGKMRSNHDSERFRSSHDPIWKIQWGCGPEPTQHKLVRQMTDRLCNAIIDPVPKNMEYSMEKGALRFTNVRTKQWFEINLIYGYVDFGNDLFSAHYEKLRVKESLRKIITETFLANFDLLLAYLKHTANLYFNGQNYMEDLNGLIFWDRRCRVNTVDPKKTCGFSLVGMNGIM